MEELDHTGMVREGLSRLQIQSFEFSARRLGETIKISFNVTECLYDHPAIILISFFYAKRHELRPYLFFVSISSRVKNGANSQCQFFADQKHPEFSPLLSKDLLPTA
jgi:hypothetical protein